MKTLTLFLFFASVIYVARAQESALKITNPNTQKEIIIKENKRLKIRTTEGQKVKGRFSIVDTNTIFIDNQEFSLTDIQEIKRDPLLTSIFTTGLLIYGGAMLIGFGALIGVLADSSAYWLMVPGAAMIFTGLKSPNFNRKFSKDKNWDLEVVSLSP